MVRAKPAPARGVAGRVLGRYAARAALFLALAAALLARAAVGRASDFWDEVRNPGLGAHRAHLRQGERALAENRADRALAEAETAIADCAGCAAGYTLRGRALSALGRHAAAVSAFEHALQLQASALDASAGALTAAASAIRIGRPELGAQILGRVLALGGETVARPRALQMLGDALQAQGPQQLRRAIVTYQEALQEPDVPKGTLLGLALALYRDGDPEQGLALARRAPIEAAPSAAKWLPESERAARLALWLRAIGDDEAADQSWRDAADAGGPWRQQARAACAAHARTGKR